MPASKEKKPDQVVFDQKTQKYSASLTPYATNLGAPAIIPEDITSWKNANIHKVVLKIRIIWAKISWRNNHRGA